jgi:sporulation delaying protein B
MTLTSLLLPITLTDDRRWHWMAKEKEDPLSSLAQIRRMVARFSFSVIRIQVAVIYLHAAVAKCAVTEWQNGTAVYYWLTDPQYGVAEWLWPVVFPMLRNPFIVTAITWGSVALEFALFAGLIAKMRYRRPLLWMGIIFHVGIAVMHGLISFSISMIGALILFLRPLENEFAFRIPFSSGGTKNEPGSSTRVQEVTLA